MASGGTIPTWTNWAGNISSRPEGFAFPESVEQLANLVRERGRAGGRVKVVGSGHSFSPIAASDGALTISLRQLKLEPSIDRAKRRIAVPAGMLLGEFVALARQHGIAPKNLGAVVGQTVAGAIATGTHGSGLDFGGLAELTTGFEVVSGTGELITVSRERDPNLWAALAVHLGSLGILTRVTFSCDDAFRLRLEQTPSLIDETLERLDQYNAARNFGFWWFPGSDRVLIRKFNLAKGEADSGSQLKRWWHNLVVRNWLHEMLLLGSSFGLLSPQQVNAAIFRAAFREPSARVDDSAEIVTSKIRIRQHVMEFSVPYEGARDVIHALRQLIRQNGFPTHSPVDIRFSGRDEAWLGLSHGRRSCFIGIVVYQPFGRSVSSDAYFRAVDDLMRGFDARPHWGKVHFRDHNDLRGRYARWDDFQAMRERLDPNRVFANAYLDRVLGP
jgi:L-gulonolactone oxidase